MTRTISTSRNAFARLRALALMAAAAGLLTGCETTGPGPSVEAAKPPEPPMTRARAASECWMRTEKGGASVPLEKRADIVNKCIDDKMKADEKMRAAPVAAPAAAPTAAPAAQAAPKT